MIQHRRQAKHARVKSFPTQNEVTTSAIRFQHIKFVVGSSHLIVEETSSTTVGGISVVIACLMELSREGLGSAQEDSNINTLEAEHSHEEFNTTNKIYTQRSLTLKMSVPFVDLLHLAELGIPHGAAKVHLVSQCTPTAVADDCVPLLVVMQDDLGGIITSPATCHEDANVEEIRLTKLLQLLFHILTIAKCDKIDALFKQ